VAESPAQETVRAFYEAINGGGPDEAVGLLSEGVLWTRPPDVPISGTLEGVEAIRKMWRAMTGSLEHFEIEPTRYEESGDRVLAQITMRGTAPEEGRSFEFAGSQVFTVHDGRITHVREFRGLDEARAALTADTYPG
jgi:ketosteroid isomerase-like protein